MVWYVGVYELNGGDRDLTGLPNVYVSVGWEPPDRRFASAKGGYQGGKQLGPRGKCVREDLVQDPGPFPYRDVAEKEADALAVRLAQEGYVVGAEPRREALVRNALRESR